MNNQEIERFDQYLKGVMSDDDLQVFEKEISQNPALRNRFKFHQETSEKINRTAFAKKMDQWHTELEQSKTSEIKRKSRNIIRSLLWIILVLIVLGLTYLFYSSHKNDTKALETDKIYARYYYPDPGLPITMNQATESIFERGMQAYKLGEYQQAMTLWNTLSKDSIGDEVQYYIGNALMASERYNEARSYFEQVNMTSPYFEKANWYQLLLFIMEGETERAKLSAARLLEQNPSFHKSDLEELLELLNDQ